MHYEEQQEVYMGTLPSMAKDIGFLLSRRGIAKDEIDLGMKHLFGKDWQDLSTARLLSSLRSKGLALTPRSPECVNEIETLVRGAAKLENAH